MTKEIDMGDTDLDALFTEARAAVPLDDTGLLARVYADGLRLQPGPKLPAKRSVASGSGWWDRLFSALGGNRGLAGLGTAAIAGVMLGFVQPTSVLALTGSLFAGATVDEVDLMPGIDAILTEG